MRHYKRKFQDIAMQNFYEWMRDLGYKMNRAVKETVARFKAYDEGGTNETIRP
jgi:hypothetical protein